MKQHGHDPPDSRFRRQAAVEATAREWAHIVARGSFGQMSVHDLEGRLSELTTILVESLLSEPFVSRPARDVGASLVAAHFTGSETLSRTIELFDDRLLQALHADTAKYRGRLARMNGALAAGFADALRERALTEHEAILRAALRAREDAEQAMRASQARFRAVFRGGATAIAIGDVNGHILDVNPALIDMLGYSASELRGQRVTDFIHPDDTGDMRELVASLIHGEREHVRMEKRFIRRDGGVVWGRIALSLVRDDEGTPSYLVAMGEDITERHHLQTSLQRQALHDSLTKLPNRAQLMGRIADALDADVGDDRVALCLIDLDGCKTVNDTLGRDVGDRLLVAVADRLSRCVSGSDQMLARMGGDEFGLVVSPSGGGTQVIEIAEHMLAALDTPFSLDRHHLSVSASVGMTERPVRETSASDLLTTAGVALEWAKAAGRGRWRMFDPHRASGQPSRFALSSTLSTAMLYDEFFIVYQPVVNLTDGAVIGAEALVRWHHPQFGVLRPGRFIAVADETGLIVPLGRWVLEHACRQAARWGAGSARPPMVCVNVTLRQCHERNFVREVARVLNVSGLPADRLQLEITESAAMTAASEALDVLRRLRQLGVRIALDDFGTGHSNIAYLRGLPLTGIKIAGAFVEGLRFGADPVGEQMVEGVVSLAHTLGLTVTAEGVETERQARVLRELGCDWAQGHLLSRPGSADRFQNLAVSPERWLPGDVG